MKRLARHPRYWLLAACLLLFGASCAAPAATPANPDRPTTEATQVQSGIEGAATATPVVGSPAILEARRLTLEWPPHLRAGDSDLVRLTLEVDDLGGITPTAELEGHATVGETVYIPDVYATHSVFAEARLDLAGMEVSPAETISQALLPGQSVTYYWSVSSDDIGVYRGTVWLYLRFLPLDGAPASERPLSAQMIEIETVNLLGMGGTSARWLGTVGLFLGGMLGLDDLLKLAKTMIQGRRTGKRVPAPIETPGKQ
ncbi:MAG TPA: hypothetical protein PKM21_06200 [Anaerolineales bacterium]|nr:hypothetical protein [Anaerolineales bacterium]